MKNSILETIGPRKYAVAVLLSLALLGIALCCRAATYPVYREDGGIALSIVDWYSPDAGDVNMSGFSWALTTIPPGVVTEVEYDPNVLWEGSPFVEIITADTVETASSYYSGTHEGEQYAALRDTTWTGGKWYQQDGLPNPIWFELVGVPEVALFGAGPTLGMTATAVRAIIPPNPALVQSSPTPVVSEVASAFNAASTTGLSVLAFLLILASVVAGIYLIRRRAATTR